MNPPAPKMRPSTSEALTLPALSLGEAQAGHVESAAVVEVEQGGMLDDGLGVPRDTEDDAALGNPTDHALLHRQRHLAEPAFLERGGRHAVGHAHAKVDLYELCGLVSLWRITSSANSTVTCLYSAGVVAVATGAPHSLQNFEFGGSSVPHDPHSTAAAVMSRGHPTVLHVDIVSPLASQHVPYRAAAIRPAGSATPRLGARVSGGRIRQCARWDRVGCEILRGCPRGDHLRGS